MIKKSMADKLIVSFEEYIKIVEKLAIEIHNNYNPTVLVGIILNDKSISALALVSTLIEPE